MTPLTRPKLELQAAVLSVRLRDEIRLALAKPVERTFMLTDTTTVPQWLQTTEKLPVFVANRVAGILKLTTTDEWNYVRTSENPVDAGTRGFSANALLGSHWLKIPHFLKTDNWPFQPSTDVSQKNQNEPVQIRASSVRTRKTRSNGNYRRCR